MIRAPPAPRRTGPGEGAVGASESPSPRALEEVDRRGKADVAVARMGEMSPDLRGCAVLDSEGRVLAASADPERWTAPAAALLAAADSAGGERATHLQVATEDGDAFAVRHQGLTMVAVAE